MNLPRHIPAKRGARKPGQRAGRKFSRAHKGLQRDSTGRFRPLLDGARVAALLKQGRTQAQIAKDLGVTRAAIHSRLKRLEAQGEIPPGSGRRVCGECGRPLPPPPEVSEAARRLASGEAAPEMNRLATAANKPIDNGERKA